ncbi:hypothetical protein BDV3_006280 [Batrachochytrium dendrobatidis]
MFLFRQTRNTNQDDSPTVAVDQRTVMQRIKAFPSTISIAEISGSFGDMATLLPILLSLGKAGQISITSSLVFGGLFNVLTGLAYDIPMCVQPMKAIAATAIASNMTQAQIVSAGMFVSSVLLFLGVTRLIHVVNKYIPVTIVRGIQMGAGLTLVMKGADSILKANLYSFAAYDWMDNFVVALLCFILVMALYRAKINPSALIIFAIGILLACIRLYSHGDSPPSPNLSFPSPTAPSSSDFAIGILKAGIGQLPLTLLNSVIAVSKLADDLYPNKAKPVAPVSSIAIFVGVMNLTGGWFGSTPYCHGSGGLAAQYRFGARTGTSVILLGIFKILIGLIFGNTLLVIFQMIPKTILGVMLAIAGMELASCARDLHNLSDPAEYQDNYIILIVTVGGILGFKNDGIGFALGCIAAIILGIARHQRNKQKSVTLLA